MFFKQKLFFRLCFHKIPSNIHYLLCNMKSCWNNFRWKGELMKCCTMVCQKCHTNCSSCASLWKHPNNSSFIDKFILTIILWTPPEIRSNLIENSQKRCQYKFSNIYVEQTHTINIYSNIFIFLIFDQKANTKNVTIIMRAYPKISDKYTKQQKKIKRNKTNWHYKNKNKNKNLNQEISKFSEFIKQ